MSIQVVVGAAEPMYRLGLRTACEAAGLTVGAELETAADVLTAPDLAPSVVVTEAEVLHPDVAATVERVSERHRVLLIEGAELDRPRLLRAGVSGFLARTVDRAALRSAVEAAFAGDLVLPVPASAAVAPVAAGPRLTRRETDVLRSLADGGSTLDCARRLHLSVTTVKTHLRSANVKLGTTSRTAATAKALGLGLLR